MAGYNVNELVLGILGRLLDLKSHHMPLTYGDSKLDELLSLIEYASIKRFHFADINGRPTKRNLHEWLKSREAGRMITHEKLFGFAEFAVAISWRANIADMVDRLLNLPEVKRSIHLSTFRADEDIQQLRAGIVRNPYIENQQGRIPINRRYGVISWRHEITVDTAGNAAHEVETNVCNLLMNELSLLTPPIFVDRPCAVEELRPWAKLDDVQRHITARIEGWTGTTGAMFLELNPPLELYQAAVIRWGYITPRLFSHGEEYYRFDVNNPMAHRLASVRFAKTWQIMRVRSLSGRHSVDRAQNKVTWEHFFPPTGIYEIRFRLTNSEIHHR